MPDETIALGPWGRGQGPLAGGGGLGGMNPFQMMSDVMQLRKTQQGFMAQQRAGEIAAQTPDLDTLIQNLTADPLVAGFAPEIINTMRQNQLALTQLRGYQSTQSREALGGFLNAAVGALDDPSQLMPIAQTHLALYPVDQQKRLMPAFQSLVTSLTHDLPSDPGQAKIEYQKRLVAQLTGAGMKPEEIYAAMGRVAPTIQTGPYGPGGAQQPVVVGGFNMPAWGGTGGTATAPPATGGGGGGGTQPAGGALAVPGAQQPGFTPLGPTGPSKTQETYLTHRGEEMSGYQKNLDTAVESGSGIIRTINEAQEAMQNFKPGAGASAYARTAEIFQALGADQKLVDRIAGGDLSAAQEMEKLMVNTTWNQIKEQMPSASRTTQMEFQTFQKNNPNINLDPRAIGKIFNFWQQAFARDRIEQRELNKHIKGGGDISEWPQQWNDRMGNMGLRDAVMKGSNGTTLPAAALNNLLDHPETADEFDRKYGKGTASKFLGN